MRRLSFIRPLLGCLIAGLLPLSPATPAASGRAVLPEAQLVVVQSDQNAIVLELTIDDFAIETIDHGGQRFASAAIAGLQQSTVPGAPQVPIRSALLGVPRTDGLHVKVLETDDEIVSGYTLYPAPQLAAVQDDFGDGAGSKVLESFEIDAERYNTDALFPAIPVELGETGYVRDQAVVQVLLYPIQYNPVHRELRVHHRLRVQITWDQPVEATRAENRPGSATYENLLRHTLLNYGSLVRPTAVEFGAASAAGSLAPDVGAGSAPTLKVAVDADGLYRLTYADLKTVGFDPGAVDPRTLKLSNRGTEIAIEVVGETDGIFDPADYILFYGTALHDAYTSRNVYWLAAGDGTGRRMMTRAGVPAANAAAVTQNGLFLPLVAARLVAPGVQAVVPHSFPTLVHAEEDTVYWQTMPGTGEDRWFWDKRLSPNTKGIPTVRPYPFVLHNIAADGDATLRVRLKGYTALNHRTRIHLNGHVLGERTWNGQVQFTHQAVLPQAWLRDGDNTVVVETLNAGATVDQVLVNWLELDYWKKYAAEGDELWFAPPATGRFRFAVDGFTQPAVTVFDVTDPVGPVQITATSTVGDAGMYRLEFEDVAWETSRYLALTPGNYKMPASLVLDQPSSWKAAGNGADYIIITHGDFYASAQVLAEHRRAAGLRVAVVNIADVYDEFSGGMFNPHAIHDFLAYAYHNWQAPAPTYVLLLGDATQDYKDNLKNGTVNYVPSLNIESSLFGEVSSDNSFACVSGDDKLPDLLIGRLVAQSSQEAAGMIANLIRYDQTPPDSSWNKSVMLVADDDEAIFKTISESLSAHLPFYYNVSRVYIDGYPPGNPKQAILDGINRGSVLVNYAGHGEYFGWGTWNYNQKSIFDVADVERLTNGTRLSVITIANCLNGFFAGPKDKPALAEVLQRRAEGGVVGVWAPTSLEYPTGHGILLTKFYDAIFLKDQVTLGAAATAAKLAALAQSSFWQELIDTYVLFGDPATRIGVPPAYPYVVETSPAAGDTATPLDQHIRIVFNKPVAPGTVVISSGAAVGVKFTPSWNHDLTAVDYTTSGLVHGQTYVLTVSGQDRQGNALGTGIVPNPWSFTVTEDNGPPTVIIEVQGGDPSTVMSKAALTITFSEPVRPGSVALSVTPTVDGSLLWEGNGRTAMFRHADLQVGQTYTLSVLSAQDVAGNWLSAPVNFEFTVAPANYYFLPSIAR